jgi:hypothetical protein
MATLPLSRFAHVDLGSILGYLGRIDAISSPWAVLLVRFQDNHDPLPSMSIYEDLFTSVGIGKMNMVDFFRDMSHGKLDISGSKIFGWYTLPYNRSDYVGNSAPGPGQLDRGGLLSEARSLATAAGVDLSKYSGVVVSCQGGVDLCGWIGGMAALCDSFSLSPSLLGQEMGHGYGLDHARLDGSTDDYRDPWDVMSTAAYPNMEENNPEFTKIGPGLNAWNMRSRGWLDESRVWAAPPYSWSGSIQLRPLHRRDLPGFLAAQIGQNLVEFRVPQGWDEAIGAPCVLVHRFEGNHSYLMPAVGGQESILAGDKFQSGLETYTRFPYYAAEVTGIDMNSLTATVMLTARPAVPFHEPSLVGEVIGGVEVDGGGAVIIGVHVIRVPPRGPAFDLVQRVAQYLSMNTLGSGIQSSLVGQRAALTDVVRSAIQLYAEADPVSEAPPGYQKEKGQISSRQAA